MRIEHRLGEVALLYYVVAHRLHRFDSLDHVFQGVALKPPVKLLFRKVTNKKLNSSI